MTRQHEVLRYLTKGAATIVQVAEAVKLKNERTRILLEILRLRGLVGREKFSSDELEGPGRPAFQYKISRTGEKRLAWLEEREKDKSPTRGRKKGRK